MAVGFLLENGTDRLLKEDGGLLLNENQAPVYQAIGAFQNGGAVALTVPWPAVHAVDDIGVLVISTGGTIPAFTDIAGFALVSAAQDIAGLSGAVYWCRATSTSMASVVTGTFTNNCSASIHTIRGCITTGNPWDVVSASTKTSTSTALSIAGSTTTLAECLIDYVAARSSDAGATQYSAEADATLASITERLDNGTTTGNGGGLGVWTGVKTAAGAYGPLTATLATTSTEVYWSVAFKSSAGDAVVVPPRPTIPRFAVTRSRTY